MGEFEPKQFGKYYLLKKLAVGGMAEIYKAKTFGVDGFEKELAIKRILPHCSADKEFITMLIDEAKLSVMLSHANIVQVYDLGKVGDDYFISMEFIHGVTLRDIIYHCREKKIQIPTDIAVYIISEMCKGLDYAHRKTDQNNHPLGIVHRDVSPQNVLISYEGEVKIVDFGIAKAAMNISNTMAGILKGKIAYMSPEQAMGKTIDGRTDIFSTGILLYEIITGTKLYTGESQFEVLKRIRTTKITAENLPDSIPVPLKPVIAKALAYNVEERYQNAGDFQIDLTKFLYTTYSDFSPRKLASFIRGIFAPEKQKEEIEEVRETVFEKQTSSMSIGEGAKQQEIVHRDTSSSRREDTDRRAVTSRPRAIPARRIAGRSPMRGSRAEDRTARKGGSLWLFGAVVAVIFTVGMLFAFVPQLQFWKTGAPHPVETGKSSARTIPEPASTERAMGTLNIITDPSGAAIMIEGKLTGLGTPATIENLPLNTDQRITLAKPNFEDFEQIVNLTSPKPQKIATKLKAIIPHSGKLVITSNPPGATVVINGKDSGRTTPATIASLEPGKYTVTLTLGDYEKWNGNYDVAAEKSVPVDATLVKTVADKAASEKPVTGGVPPAPPQPAATEKGQLKVSSVPEGAKIMMDGRSTGQKTPAIFNDLKVGSSYNFRFDLDGYKSAFSKKAMKTASETLIAKLAKEEEKKPEEKPVTPTPPPVTPETTPPAQATPPPVKETPPAKEKPAAKETPPHGEKSETKSGNGTIKVASNPPGADVFINEEHKGTTPLSVSVPAGPASVLVSKQGLSRVSRQITVKPGQTVSLTDITLGDIYGEVTISSDPTRASVTYDGQSFPAATPLTIRKVKRDKQHTITVSLPGHKPWSTSFNMDEAKKSFNVQLQPQ